MPHDRVVKANILVATDGSGLTLATGGGGGGSGGGGATLGAGAFGKVGTYSRYGATVAVKELKAGADNDSIGASAALHSLQKSSLQRMMREPRCPPSTPAPHTSARHISVIWLGTSMCGERVRRPTVLS